MLPWPIAVVIVVYAMVGTVSAASCWRGLLLGEAAGLWPSAVWSVVSAILVIGLAFMRPWARRAAVWASVVLMAAALAMAWMAAIVTPPSAKLSLLGTVLATVQLFLIRYLTRPHVKRWFAWEV